MDQPNQKKTHFLSKKILRHIILSGFLEFGPVLIFLTAFQYLHIYEATFLLMIATIISTIVTHRVQKRIPYMALYVAAITLVFGYMTLHFHQVKFIQMRDTLYDLTCALTLMVGRIINVPFLKIAFNEVLPMTMRAWNRLTNLWIGYFIIVASSNEIIRRFFSLEGWFEFKGWMVLLTTIFGLVALYLSYEPKEDADLWQKELAS